MSDDGSDPLDEIRKRIDDVILLAIASAGAKGIDISDFLDRETLDALARLSERGFIEPRRRHGVGACLAIGHEDTYRQCAEL